MDQKEEKTNALGFTEDQVENLKRDLKENAPLLMPIMVLAIWLGGGRHLRAISRNTAATRHAVDQLNKTMTRPVMVLTPPKVK